MAMSKKKKILVIAGCVAGGLVLLLAAAYNVALSSSVICSRWPSDGGADDEFHDDGVRGEAESVRKQS